jgi:hypothetical protein
VIEAPAKAHPTESHMQKALKHSNFPYFIQISQKATIAHNGVIIQNIISWVYLEAPHQ